MAPGISQRESPRHAPKRVPMEMPPSLDLWRRTGHGGRVSYSRILLVALVLGCVSASEEVLESTADVEAPAEEPVVVPAQVTRAALGVRSSILLTREERLLRQAAQELGCVERAWF